METGPTEETQNSTFDYNYEYDEVCDKGKFAQVGSIAVPVIFALVVLLSLIGNVLVLVILARLRSLEKLHNILILNLVVSDLIFTLGLPFWSCQFIWGWTFGENMCKAVSFVFSVGFYSSIVFLLMLNILRFLRVIYVFFNWDKLRPLRVALPIIGWVLSIGAALPALFQNSVLSDTVNPDILYCKQSSIEAILTATYQQNALFVVTFIVMGFTDTVIFVKLYRHYRRKVEGTLNRQGLIRFVCLAAVFFVLWAPYNIVTFVQTFHYYHIKDLTDCTLSDNLDYAHFATTLLAYSHCCLNPVVYVLILPRFREHLTMNRYSRSRNIQTEADTGFPFLRRLRARNFTEAPVSSFHQVCESPS